MADSADDALVERYVLLAATRGEAAVEQIAALSGSAYASVRAAAVKALGIFRGLPPAERERLRSLGEQGQPLGSTEDLAAESVFAPRPDGLWDYFPWGFHKTGYVVDDGTRTRLLDEDRGARKRLRRLTMGILLLVFVGGPALGRRYPSVGLYTAHSMILALVYAAAMAATFAVVFRQDRRRIARALSGAPPAPPDPRRAGHGAVQSLVDLWHRRSGAARVGLIAMAALLVLGVARLPVEAARHLSQPDLPSRVAGIIELGWFVAAVGVAGWALVREIRGRRPLSARP